MHVYTTFTWVILAATLLASGLYALWIALRPFPDHLTWLSVVIGVAMTIVPFSVVVWHLTGSIALACLILTFFAATGGPMIVGQLAKHWLLWQSSNGHHNEWSRDDDLDLPAL